MLANAEILSEKETLTESVLVRLRHDIVSGFYKPNQNLRIEMLKQRYEMGASPLREALARLVTEGFVVNEANRGFRVAPMSKEDLADITLVRQAIEAQALKCAMEKGGDDWEVAIVAALHRLTLAANKSYSTREERLLSLDEAHWQFHRAVTTGCGSPRLLELQETFYRQGVRYRQVMLDWMVDAEDFVARHEMLTQALLKRDYDFASRSLHEHIGLTSHEVFMPTT